MGIAEPLQSMRLPFLSAERKGKKGVDDRKLSYVFDKTIATGIGTCAQSGMTFPSDPSSEMHLGKLPDHTEFQSWIANFRTEVLLEIEELHARIAVDQGNRIGQIAG